MLIKSFLQTLSTDDLVELKREWATRLERATATKQWGMKEIARQNVKLIEAVESEGREIEE